MQVNIYACTCKWNIYRCHFLCVHKTFKKNTIHCSCILMQHLTGSSFLVPPRGACHQDKIKELFAATSLNAALGTGKVKARTSENEYCGVFLLSVLCVFLFVGLLAFLCLSFFPCIGQPCDMVIFLWAWWRIWTLKSGSHFRGKASLYHSDVNLYGGPCS